LKGDHHENEMFVLAMLTIVFGLSATLVEVEAATLLETEAPL
jgi:hypothetical protein